MTCEHCCGADKLFDLKGAQKELKQYRKKGPGKITRKLLACSKPEWHKDKTLLDIGGGIGAIQWFHFNHGGKICTHVDASSGYQQVAQEYAQELGVSENSKAVFGDFLDVAENIGQHDIVSLDKVVCCYPNMEELLTTALKKCRETLILSYPMDWIIAVWIQNAVALYMKYAEKSAFRPYIHSVKDIRKTIENEGLELVDKGMYFPMHVEVYRRVG
jgi:magnesium-protoporphyrin O-methyltransferase